MNIHLLVLDGVFDLGLAALQDTLATANELAPLIDPMLAPWTVTPVGVRRRVRTGMGLQISLQPADEGTAPDVLIAPALSAKQPEALQTALARKDVKDAALLLQQRAQEHTSIGAACTATFVLGESGLLDGHRATTTWWLAPLFRARYPGVAVDESKMVVTSDPFFTAGAALAHVDLALSLIRQRSPALAQMTARYLLVDERASQASFVIPDHLAHKDPVVEKFEHWARARLQDGFSMEGATHALATSERTLSRRMQQCLGKSPLSYFQDLRVERAVHLLQTTSLHVEQVAAQVGYADGVTLRTLLRKRLGKGVRELRR